MRVSCWRELQFAKVRGPADKVANSQRSHRRKSHGYGWKLYSSQCIKKKADRRDVKIEAVQSMQSYLDSVDEELSNQPGFKKPPTRRNSYWSCGIWSGKRIWVFRWTGLLWIEGMKLALSTGEWSFWALPGTSPRSNSPIHPRSMGSLAVHSWTQDPGQQLLSRILQGTSARRNS